MLICINKNLAEYQTLLLRSGISDFLLESICRDYLDKYGRLPYLDEIQGSNSEPVLRKELKLDLYNSTKTNSILEITGRNNVKEANAVLNDLYRDLEIEIIPLNKDSIVDIIHKPTMSNFNILPVQVDSEPNSFLVLNNSLLKLGSLYGIAFNEVTDAELNSDQWNTIIEDPSSVNAFVYNGLIYINMDKQSVDAPLHEMMHIFTGSIRFLNPALYTQLILLAEKFPNYNNLKRQFSNRTRNDINEEIFIREVSKYLSGLPSNIENISKSLLHEISYNIKRLLDIILMGLDSVKTLSDNKLYTLSLKLIALEVNSSIMTNKFKGMINVEGSELHRKLNNIKADLYKKGELKELCE